MIVEGQEVDSLAKHLTNIWRCPWVLLEETQGREQGTRQCQGEAQNVAYPLRSRRAAESQYYLKLTRCGFSLNVFVEEQSVVGFAPGKTLVYMAFEKTCRPSIERRNNETHAAKNCAIGCSFATGSASPRGTLQPRKWQSHFGWRNYWLR